MITLEPGKTSELSPRVRRIVAPNPSVMTGPGTNTYLVGRELVAVIDPGPDECSHVEAILAAGAGRIRWILVTHTHEDHSPAAATLARATGAELWGQAAPEEPYQDQSFRPDVPFRTAPCSRARSSACAPCTRPDTRRITTACCSRKRAC